VSRLSNQEVIVSQSVNEIIKRLGSISQRVYLQIFTNIYEFIYKSTSNCPKIQAQCEF